MSLRELLRSLVRRWYVVLLGLLLTAGLAFVAVSAAPPTYESRAYVALLPGEATYPENSNPFLYLGGGTQIRDILLRVMTTDEVREAVLGDTPGAGFSVVPDPMGGPLVLVAGVATTPNGALETTSAVLDQLPAVLDDLQASRQVPVRARFTTLVVSQDAKPTVVRSNTTRATVIAVAAGLAATVLVTVWFDGMLSSRRRGRRAAHADVATSPSEVLEHGTSPYGGAADESESVARRP
ncbi:Wzz/FepE/Etk N-terminal domain-containing protein [uncultured Georgenia sp.]|uniref:Wzz/FepE/Etk N-terminal domain-containing protein n=1 Tax=uncultured Georgenia sp. TaxID=378209 RepID=UPI002617CA34|nr:Wzz/FepE/Etk N-terminal domain-containing protein [uncultured Georgenia sp.]HLS34106.1 Wzz/FepE/Etk N-terminal domain-containing protein [Brevibacterium sp.]HLV03697.1 Wzz/FepE/Etk N-terminal domain-containing protein [Actinomycetaceae bacterium]